MAILGRRRAPWFSSLALVLVAAVVLEACEQPSASSDGNATVGVPGSPGTVAGTPVPASEPDSATKIDLAEKAGVIDHETALLYKVYAALDYGSPPEAYRSSDATRHEATTILAELGSQLAQLSPDVRMSVEPFLLRPTDPNSFCQLRGSGTYSLVSPATTRGRPARARVSSGSGMAVTRTRSATPESATNRSGIRSTPR